MNRLSNKYSSSFKNLLPLRGVFLGGIFLIAALLFGNSSQAQSFGRKYRSVLPKKPQFSQSHWQFAPGITYSPSVIGGRKQTALQSGDSSLIAQSKPHGKFGLYAEIGRYHITDKFILFSVFDYGLAYKSTGGRENYDDYWEVSDAKTPVAQGESSYRQHNASAFANAYFFRQIKEYDFLLHGPGINIDYAFINKFDNTHTLPGIETWTTTAFNIQLHYKISYGIKMRGNWMILPSLETPILNILPFTSGIPGTQAFSSRYQPFTLSCKIMLLKPWRQKFCPPVKSIEAPQMPDKGE
ncbi:hypothetical protein N9C06_01080 [Salibacteraceae bacterium]|nr:hypothetical protein [Salibacteraceae bacterium]